MPLTDAATTMVAELSRLSGREADLRRDLLTTRTRIDKLLEGLDAVLNLLDRPDRQALRDKVMALDLPLNRRFKTRRPSERVDTVHAWLADQEGPFTAAQVQAMLAANGLTDGRHNASIILSRKVGQGMVRRLGRGRYQVCAWHPEITARRVRNGQVPDPV